MRWVTFIAAIACASLRADVVTRRIGTGLPPGGPASLVPETWVAPVGAPPAIDGHLDDAAWSETRPIVLGALLERRSTSPRTEVRLIRDQANLYAAFRLAEPDVGAIRARVAGADGSAWEDDSVEIFLTPRPGGSYYQIIAGAGGAVFDRTDHNDPAAWNSGARAAVAFGDDEWSVEIAIPFASMGIEREMPERWRANFTRNRRTGPEGASQAWSPTFRPDYDVPERFGTLLFTPDPPPDPLAARPEGKPGIEIGKSSTGKAQIHINVSFLSAATRIHRARLICERTPPEGDEALAPIEINPGAPAALAPPEFRGFDVTAMVRHWRTEVGEGSVLVDSFPGWIPQDTYLEVMYDGPAGERPRQAAGLEVFHRAGQTFISWQEVDPPIEKGEATWGEIKAALARARDGIRYRIYAHQEPIDGASIWRATLIADVDPLSGFNVNARNVEYLIGQAMLAPDEMGELARDYNGYIYTWGMDHARMDRYPVPRFVTDEEKGPLAPGMGLYVHNPGAAGRRYYAVVSCDKGVENLIDFSPANSLPDPVDETVGPGEPVLQGPGLWGPYFDYPGRRQVWVQWCAPPLAPLPGMAFNWSVLVPPDLAAGAKAPLELTLHAGNSSYAKPRKKYLRGSIQIAPHDWPPSGWYGFHDAYETLRSWRDGAVRNHTQKRILAFLDQAERRFPIDPERIILCGSDGAAMLALEARDRFAYVLIEGFGGAGKLVGDVLDPDRTDAFAAAWGPKSPLIRDERGRTEWGWAMLDALAAERPGQSAPLLVCAGASWGGVRQYAKAFGPFYTKMQEAGQPLIAGFGWDTKLVPPDEWTGLWGPRLHLAMEPLDIARMTPIPAFARSSRTQETEQWGNINYMHAWKDLRDEPDAFRITLAGEGTVDLTPRRLQRFAVKPGEIVRWEAGGRSGAGSADANGLVTLKALEIPAGGLTVTILRAQERESR
ncbi:MAG: carbohydrate-binding family 9-like protein [Planctomycetes bacterium]|nr:carbohydrate-binding family 9-like protein [Planctomycetota bacterium]